MYANSAQHLPTFATLVTGQQQRLVRLCAYFTSDLQAAEDLAQETLLIAWQHRQRISDPNGFSHWLNAIARNVCRHHLRGQRRAAAHLALPAQWDDTKLTPTVAVDTDTRPELAADFDLEVELERAELVTLLDRAMGLLPPETRSLLVQHYLEELPQAELAAKVGVSTSALAVRLHRGKLALRHLLTTELSDEAIALGLVAPEAIGWNATRIWCFACGKHHLEAQFNQSVGHLRLRCPGCCNPHDENDVISNSQALSLNQFKAYKPAYSSVLKFIHDYYIKNAQAGIVHCYLCGQATPMRLGSPPGMPYLEGVIYTWCEHCEEGAGIECWWSLTHSLPQVRQFWQKYPRMRIIPVRHLAIANTPAIVTGFESMTTGAHIEAAFSTNTFELIYVEQALTR